MIRHTKTYFRCDKCGKEIEYNSNWKEINDMYSMAEENKCWSISLGRAGYGSKLDTCNVNFDLCDDCLYELIFSMKHNEVVFETGC